MLQDEARAPSWTSWSGCGALASDKYEAAFRENEIDETVLPSLTAEDLKELGVGVVGHRRKLLDAIAALRAEDEHEDAVSHGALIKPTPLPKTAPNAAKSP